MHPNVTVVALRRGATALAVSVTVVAGLLSPAASAAGGGIAGQVALPDGQPAGQICVEAASLDSSTPHATTTTADDGRYSLSGLADGHYTVEFTDCGGRDLVDAYWPGRFDANEARQLTVAGGVTTADQSMSQGGEIVGHVYDKQGNPLSSNVVYQRPDNWPDAWGYGHVWTGSGGSYVIHGVPPGTWRLHADGNGNSRPTWSGDTDDYASAATVTVTASAQSTMDFHIPRAGTISGAVVDDAGAPRANVCVRGYGSTESTWAGGAATDSDGHYVMRGVRPGPVRIVAVNSANCEGAAVWYGGGDSYAHATPVDLGEGQDVVGIDFTVPEGPHIAGRVVGPDGEPLADVFVELYDGVNNGYTQTGVSTDSDGRFRFTGLQSKLYKVQAYAGERHQTLLNRFWPSAGTAEEAVAIPATPTTDDIDILLPLGGSITGRVTRRDDGTPVLACVEADGADPGHRGYDRGSSDGTYRIDGLDDGDYHLFFHDCGAQTVTGSWWHSLATYDQGETVTITRGQVIPGVDQALAPGGAMHGRVVDGDGNPIAGVCVDVDVRNGADARTDSNGSWSVGKVLTPGVPYTVSVSNCGNAAPWVPKSVKAGPVAGGEDLAVPDVVLHHGGSFSGTVIDQFGHPVENVCVTSVSDDAYPVGGDWTSPNGTFTAAGLEPGTYTAHFRDCGAGMVATYWHSPTRDLAETFTVQPDQTTTGIDQTVVVFTLPSLPLDVVVDNSVDSATLHWSPPADDGHTPVTGYEVDTPTGIVAVGQARRAFTVNNLVAGSTYGLSVAAVNEKGVGEAATVVAHPQPVGTLTLHGPRVLASGSTGTLAGRITLADATGAANQDAGLYRRRVSGGAWKKVSDVRTDSAGDWRAVAAPRRPLVYSIRYAGKRATYLQHVAAAIGVTRHGSVVSIRTRPHRPREVARLQRHTSRGWHTKLRRRLDARGTTDVRLTAGRWRVTLPSDAKGWATSTSRTVRIR